MPTFNGYSTDSFGFLQALAFNNNKEWFEAHRGDYEELILKPSLALITDMAPVIAAISPHYRALAKKVGGSLMRIHRDTRFSADKTPYKTNVGIQFRHEASGDVHAPAWYLHLASDECFAGAGSWHPEAPDLLAIRQRIAARPEEYRYNLARSTGPDGMPVYEGESRVRVPKGFDPDHPLAAELRRVDFLLSRNLDPALYLSAGLVEELARRFAATAPYMRFLCEAVGAAF
jgi:uncharacterized protein (TIGR02453 family)